MSKVDFPSDPIMGLAEDDSGEFVHPLRQEELSLGNVQEISKVKFPSDLPLILMDLSEDDLGSFIYHLAQTDFSVGNIEEMEEFYRYLYDKDNSEDGDGGEKKDYKVTEMPLENYTGFYLEIISGNNKPTVYVFHLSGWSFLLAEDNVQGDYKYLEKPKYIFERVDREDVTSVSLYYKNKEGETSKLELYRKMDPDNINRYINGTIVREIKDSTNLSEKLTEEITYYKNGQIRRIRNFKNGLLDGIEEVWAHDGKTLLLRVTWRNGLKHGLEEKWFLLDNDEPLTVNYYHHGEEMNSHNYNKLIQKELQKESPLLKDITDIIGKYSDVFYLEYIGDPKLRSEYAYGQEYSDLLLQELQQELPLPKELTKIIGGL